MTPNSRTGAGRRSLATLICGALAAGGLAAAGVTALEPEAATASSHREAPLISGTPQFDNTDLYAFVSPDKPDTTTIIANWIPFEEPAGGPNFFTFADDAQYDLRVDRDGDAREDLVFLYTFRTHTKNDKTFLYNTGPVESLDDPRPSASAPADPPWPGSGPTRPPRPCCRAGPTAGRAPWTASSPGGT